MSTALTEPTNYATLENSAALNLNPRQISFVHRYIEVKVGWKAAKLAGYSGNRDTLSAIASENLKKPSILLYYNELLREMHISSDEVLAELGQIARAQVSKKSVVKPVDKLKALELAGKHHKLFVDKIEAETNLSENDFQRILGGLCSILDEARRRQEEKLLAESSSE